MKKTKRFFVGLAASAISVTGMMTVSGAELAAEFAASGYFEEHVTQTLDSSVLTIRDTEDTTNNSSSSRARSIDPVFSVGTIALSLSELQACDYKVSVPITIDNTGGWYNLGFGVKFDPSEMTISNMLDDGAVQHARSQDGYNVVRGVGINNDVGKLWAGYATIPDGATTNYVGDGLVCNITFVINENASYGDAYAIAVMPENEGNVLEVGTADGVYYPSYISGMIIITNEETTTSITTATTSRTTTTTTTETTETVDTGVTGDADESGTVELNDASDVLSIYAKMAAGISVEENDAADVDENGSVELSDASAILSYYAQCAAGMTPSWDKILV